MQTETKADTIDITARGLSRPMWQEFRSIAVRKGYTVNELLTILILEFLSRER